VLNWFAWPGYTSTLAEPRFYGVLSLLALPHPRPAARRIARTKASRGFEIISWCWLGCRPFGSLALPVSDRVGLVLVLHSPAQPDGGGSGASLHGFLVVAECWSKRIIG
jgi:hypothetical protein